LLTTSPLQGLRQRIACESARASQRGRHVRWPRSGAAQAALAQQQYFWSPNSSIAPPYRRGSALWEPLRD
jgi:hypothetical protein